MITKELFTKFIENAQAYQKELDRWSGFGIDLFELPISELSWEFYNRFLEQAFTQDGIDWVNWWMFEKIPPYGGEPLEAYDVNDNIIPTDTIDDLWEIVKDYQK